MPYTQSQEFTRSYNKYQEKFKKIDNVQARLVDFVLTKAPPNNPQAAIQLINKFCSEYWMMNLGQQKGEIVTLALKKYSPKTILELGGYCGFSALLMASRSQAIVHTIEISQYFANLARRIHQHAGVANRIVIHVGTVQTQQQFVKKHGKFDFIFIDHVKNLYLSDFKLLDQMGAVKKGTVVVGDNIIYPGAPDYLQFFKQSSNFNSILYHSYLQYSNQKDAVLISQAL